MKDGEKIIAEKDFLLLAEKRIFWFVTKKSTSKKSSSRNFSGNPSLKIQKQDSGEKGETLQELSLVQKIFFVFILSFSLLFALLHMIFIQFSPRNTFLHPNIFSLQFATRQKILLAL